ncbi:MAG: glycerate kinase [Akkermansiaceae bacterium]
MRILIAPDKFKGSLSGQEAAEAIAKGLIKVFPKSDIVKLPLADGGEGLLDAFREAKHTNAFETQVLDALGRYVRASWLMVSDENGSTAIIESSQANGLWRIPETHRNVDRSSSFGVGQLIVDAMSEGADRILIGIGGSATNDAAIGIASALGCRFLDHNGNPLEAIPENFTKISTIDSSKLISTPPITVACDVVNPLFGIRGATQVYGPQKGLDSSDFDQTEKSLQHFTKVVNTHFKSDFTEIPGSGAAGGLGYGLMSFLSAELQSGFNCIAEVLDAEHEVSKSDLVITAEGSLDSQSLEGKTPIGVSRLARKHGIPVYAFAGRLADEHLLHQHFDGLASIVNRPMSLEFAVKNGAELLELAAERLARILSHSHSL